jgi:glycosyltransferase involved in cell wall biosynthesis
MRVVFAHDHRFRHGPGGEVYTLGSFPASLWDRYLEHFEEVCVVARDGGSLPDGARLSRADRAGVTFEFLPSLSSFRQLLFRSLDLDARMHSIVQAADAVVARVPSEMGLLALRHAKRLKKPYAVEVVGCAWDGYLNNGALTARMYAPLGFLRNRRAISDAPLALYVTSSWLQERYPTKGESASASNVYLLAEDPAAVARREERLAALAKDKRPVLGTIASLQIKSKGIQTALAAISMLRKTGLDLTYHVLGAGDAEPWKRLASDLGISDLVFFDGTRRAGDEVYQWLDDIDIHLQPSFQEGLPRATIEAMSRGVACVGSTCGGIPEVLPPARLHRPGDAAGLAAIIRRLADDPAALAAASRADREAVRQFDAGTLQVRRSAFFARLRERAEQHAT